LREFLAGLADHPTNRIDEILTGRLTVLTAVRNGAHGEWPGAGSSDIRKM